MADTLPRLDREGMRQIYEFAARWLGVEEEVSPSRVESHLSRLRWLWRRTLSVGGPADLLELSLHPDICARILREPGDIGRTEVSAALQAYRNFLQVMLPGREGERRMAAIEARLIPRPTKHWYEAERVAGGWTRAAGQPRRLLFFEDLLRLVEKAREGKQGERAQRDGTLIALLCSSPLRWGEIVNLRWEQLRWHEPRGDAAFGAWVRCRRRDTELLLPVHRRASDPLAVLYAVSERIMDRQPEGSVFRALRYPYLPLSYRDAKKIFDETLSRAELKATRQDLLAAYAYCLKTSYGYTIPDLREALGYSEVKHARLLLQTHDAWELNRKVDELGVPFNSESA